MSKCATCSNAIFVALWGEYKCAVKQRVIFQPELFTDCTDYKKGEPRESKSNTDYTSELYCD